MTQVRYGDRRGFARKSPDAERRERVIERLFPCPILGGGDVSHDGCTQLSGSFESNQNGCRKERCQSPWRLCVACVASRAEHPRLSADPTIGFCSQHQRDGESILREHAPRPQLVVVALAPHKVRESNGAVAPIGKPMVAEVPDTRAALERLVPTEAPVIPPDGEVVAAAAPPPVEVAVTPVANGPAAAPVPEVTPLVAEVHPPAAAEAEEAAASTPPSSEDAGRDEFAVLREILEMQRRFPELNRAKIGAKFGRTFGWVSQHLSLQRLSPKVVELMDLARPRDQRIGYSLAVLYLVKFDHALQEELAQEVLGKAFDAAVWHIRERTRHVMLKRGPRKPREE